MSDWQNLVPKQDRENYSRLYGRYLDNLPEGIEVTSITGSNPGYFVLSQNSRVYLKTKSGSEAALVLSTDNPTYVECSLKMEDVARRPWKELEASLHKVVDQEETKLFELASHRVYSSDRCENIYGFDRLFFQQPWLAFTLRNIMDGMYVYDFTRCSDGVEEVSLENSENRMLFKCNFSISSGFEIKETKFMHGVFDNKKRQCKEGFRKSAEEAIKKAKSFQGLSEWHKLSIRSQHVLAKEDWLIPLAKDLKENKIQVLDLWAARSRDGNSYHYMDIALMPDHPNYEDTLEDKKGPRGRIICDDCRVHKVNVRPLCNSAYAVQDAVLKLSKE